jgi:hypothetical protein
MQISEVGVKSLSKVDKLYALIFSDISLGLVIPIILGVLILAFPTWIFDLLSNIHIFFPEAIWGGPEIPLQHILTIGVAEGILTCAIPVVLGLVWSRWAGGSSGFLCSLLFTLGMAAYYGPGEWGFVPTLDWLGIIVSGMLAGYIAGSLMTRFRMQGSDNFKTMLISALVAATVATVFTTVTYIWFSPMFSMGIGEGPGLMSYWDAQGLTWFTYIAIYFVWALFATIAAKISTWFR